MRYIVLCDTHLGIYNASDLWHGTTIRFFKEILKTAYEQNIRNLLHLGDFFHNRKSTNTKTLDIGLLIMSELSSWFSDININIGNHDAYYKNKLFPNTLQIFKDISNINIISVPTILDEKIIMVPWMEKIEELPEAEYLFGHLEIKDFKMNSSYRCKTGLSKRSFEAFRHVYLGHFHTPSTMDNISYLGSPYGLTFNDINSTRGYYIFDSDSGKMEFIEFDAPKFVHIKTENIKKEDVEGNFVKLIFQKDYGHIQNQRIVDDVSDMKPLNLNSDFSQIKFSGTDEEQEEINLKIIDHNGIIKQYIEKSELPEHIQKRTLLNFMEKLRRN
jgi:DNA repair exonuclease SbcCD nuclease subunit